MFVRLLAIFLAPVIAGGCALSHSKQAITGPAIRTPSADATFVTEEDSGLAIGGLLTVSEPDHYVVLHERLKRRYRCGEIHSLQLDYYTEHWVIVAFEIARLTAVCEPSAVRSDDKTETSTTS